MLVPGPVADRNIDHRSFFTSKLCSAPQNYAGTTMRFSGISFSSFAEIFYYNYILLQKAVSLIVLIV